MSKASEALQALKQLREGKIIKEENASELYIQASKSIMDSMKYLHKAKSEDNEFATKYHDQLADIYEAMLTKGKE